MEDLITSAKNERLRNVSLLQKKKKARDEQNRYVIEGARIFEDALRSAPELIDSVFASESFLKGSEWERLTGIKQGANGTGNNLFDPDRVIPVADKVFESICETVTPQGILCVMRMKEYNLSSVRGDRMLLLENIQDPGNLGTMLRTTEACGMSGIVMSRDTVDIYSPKVTRSTMGAIFRVPFLYSHDLGETIETLKSDGVTVYGAYLRNGKLFDEVSYKKPSAIVIGNEGNGISDEVIDKVNERVFIPMMGQTESLNASVAAAVIMYEMFGRQSGRR